MGLYNKYPYTDFHELNNDWMLNKVKDLDTKMADMPDMSHIETDLQSMQTAITDAENDISALQSGKVDKVIGKGLSTNDFTDADKTKLDGIEAGAEVNVQADWNEADTTADSYIQNKPTVPAQKIWFATCDTAAGTAAKVATSDSGNFVLTSGNMVRVKFTSGNSFNGTATLNVDGTGAKSIARVGSTTTTRYYWVSGEVVDLVYDGTNFVMSDKGTATTTYYGLTKLSSSVSSTSESLAATPKAIKTVNDALANKVDKETGKGLSSNDFTDADVTKLSGIAAGAEVNVQADWNEADNTADSYIQNKPDIQSPLHFEYQTVACTGGSTDLTAPSVSGYTFMAWINVSCSGFVGAPYISYPLSATTKIWDHNSGSGNYIALALYYKS